MDDLFRTIIVPTKHVDLARRIAASFGPGGENMWPTALSAKGTLPATHYVSSGYIPAAFASLVPFQTWGRDIKGVWAKTDNVPGDPTAIYNLAKAQGVVCTQTEVSALFSAADVTDQLPFDALDRLNLRIARSITGAII